MDYESPERLFETGIGLAFDTQKAIHGHISFEHDNFITSYLGFLNPLYNNIHASIGTRMTYHMSDRLTQSLLEEGRFDLGLYTGIKYAVAPHVTFFTRIEPISLHPSEQITEGSHPPSIRYFREAMSGIILFL